MFTLKSTYEKRVQTLLNSNKTITEEMHTLSSKLKEAEAKIDEMVKHIPEQGYVRIEMNDALNLVKPVFSVTDKQKETLVEEGVISDGDVENNHTVHLGMLIRVYDAIGEILDQYAYRGDKDE